MALHGGLEATTFEIASVAAQRCGASLYAVVQPVDMNEAGPELARELLAFCKERLAGYKCPKAIDFDPDLPRQPTGKLYKRLIRDRYWGNKTSRIV